ncbi:MAG: RNA polymerase sigma-70 factor (ECF subfamily) [Bacteroidia bacterium]|jgi:RNA polymerase sigma-70 factor (ECF subfamily)
MTDNPEVADDHTQDILIMALKALETYGGDAKYCTWLYSITYNHCATYLRDTKRIKFGD